MKMILTVAMVAALVALCGCIEYEEDLTLNADGSGTLKVKYAMQEQMAAMGGSDEGKGELPMDKKKVEDLFAKTDGVTVSDVNVSLEDEKRVVTFTLKFDSLDKLVASNFAPFKDGAKFVKNEDGTFNYERKSMSNEEMGGPKVEKTEEPETPEGEEIPEGEEAPEGMEKMGEEMAKGMMKGMMGGNMPKFTYKVNFPATITETNADKHEGSSAEWKVEIDMENPDAAQKDMMTAKTAAPGEAGFPIVPVVIVVVIILVGLILLATKKK